jgi:hypothetical protein
MNSIQLAQKKNSLKRMPLPWLVGSNQDTPSIQLSLEFNKFWNDVVSFFTSATLTVREDRKYALSGAIKAMEEHTGRKCFLGLWDYKFLHTLLWLTSNQSEEQLDALTWLWFSIIGMVVWHEYSPKCHNVASFESIDFVIRRTD